MTNTTIPPAQQNSARWWFLFAAWLIALAATLGALFLGEVMGYAPCNLCWYQRVFMFPLAILLACAAFRADAGISIYAGPLAVLGLAIATYHSLLFAEVIPATIEPCGVGPSCSGAGQTLAGIVPMPYLSAAAFAAVRGLLLLAHERRPK